MTAPAPTTRHAVLSQDEAEDRAARLANVSYDIAIDLQRGAETYRGDVAVHFDARGDRDLFLEHRGRRIEGLELNGNELEPAWDGNRITLPGDQLRDRNTLRVRYENAYDRTGDGFHHYVDPEDGEEYLYSNFEPYDAHRLFPCFDQPDVKATYRLTVSAPAEWTIIGNGREIGTESLDDGRVRHEFEPTAAFSTYLFALVAGPYRSVYREHAGVRMGLLCRGSLERYLDPDEIFTVTAQGIDFYAELFERPYPFTKYDQIFCPEYNIGAMENVGAVTIAERYVFRDPPTETQRRTRAEIVLHELAHMWFGNLVTLRWWNDLWLNESFATYISYLALVEATRFKEAWNEFVDTKQWAYKADEMPTTHPVAGPAPDTDAAFLNFDGITYGKGAAVLKQLVATIGLDGFREGMRIYFRRHAFGNATLGEFLAALEEGSGRELGRWAEVWLETSSVNTLAARWQTDGSALTELVLEQSAPDAYPILRPHTVEVGLAAENGDALSVDAIRASIDGARTDVPAARGRRRPDFVFPNHNDHAYAKVALDPESLAYLRHNLSRVGDPLLRQLVWLSLWHMVRDQQLRSTEYLELARTELPHERDAQILEGVLFTVATSLASYVPESQREVEAHRFFEAGLTAIAGVPHGDLQLIWARALIGVAAVREDVETLVALADGARQIEGLTIDQEMRWAIAVRAVAFALPGAADRLAGERQRDPSDRADRFERRAEAATPERETKASVWERLTSDSYPSLQLGLEAMQGFNWPSQRALLEPYAERYFEVLPRLFETTEQRYAVSFVRNLFPTYRPEPAILERSERLLEEIGDGNPTLARLLREANADLARAMACREYAEASREGANPG